MNLTIGTAPDSWGVWFPDDARQTPWPRFLDEVTEAGYQWIEFGPYGYLPTDLSVLRGELERRALKVSGSFVIGDLANPAGWPELEHALRSAAPTLNAQQDDDSSRHVLHRRPRCEQRFPEQVAIRERAGAGVCAPERQGRKPRWSVGLPLSE